jgi:hypothetical protein
MAGGGWGGRVSRPRTGRGVRGGRRGGRVLFRAGGGRSGRAGDAPCSASYPSPSTCATWWAGSSFSSCEGTKGRANAVSGGSAGDGARSATGTPREGNPTLNAVRGWISPDNSHFLALRLRGPHVRLELRLTLGGVLHLARQEPGEPPHGVRRGRRCSRGTRGGMTGPRVRSGKPNRARLVVNDRCAVR